MRPGLALACVLAAVAALCAFAPVLLDAQPFPGAMFQALAPALYVGVGTVILVRLPGHRLGRLALGIGVALAVSVIMTALVVVADTTDIPAAIEGSPFALIVGIALGLTSALSGVAMLMGASLLLVWFPDGRTTSRAGRLAQVLIVIGVFGAVVASLREPIVVAVGDLGPFGAILEQALSITFLALFGAYGLAVIDLSLRYRHADPVRRAQMRWVIGALVIDLALAISAFAFSEQIDALWNLWIMSTMLPVLAVAIAITRYHLYDIDRIVSRSIAYVVVTAVLVAVVGSLILILQSLISGAVAGPGSELDPVVVAISTLVVAAMFDPLRRRVQASVDHRFNRAHYDAERTVAGFAGRLRDQLDLPTLTGELRRTTVRAVEPATTDVWLRAKAGAG